MVIDKELLALSDVANICGTIDILPRINSWDSLDYNNITSPIGVDIV